MSDLQRPIKLHQGGKEIELPLINLIRICLMELKDMVEEYQKIDPNITKFWDWLLHVKLGVQVGGKILK